MPPSPQPLSRILAADATIAAWDARRRREEVLTQLVRRYLPRALAARVRAADVDGAELTLLAEAGAIAAIVRQRTPDLLIALRNDGWQFSGIRMRVQVRNDPVPAQKPVGIQPNRDALKPLAELARGLPVSPLKRSLERLLRKIG